MTARTRWTYAVVSGLALAGSIALPASASARHHHHASPPAVTKFAVSPSRSLIPYQRGVITVPFRVENAGASDITISARIMQGHQRANGTSVFTPPAPGSGAGWFLSLPATFTLRPGQTVSAPARLRIPRSARGTGQHYLAVLFYSQDPPRPGKIGVTVQSGIDAELIISTGGTPRHGAVWSLSAPRLSWGGTVPLRLSVRNTGNVLLLANHLTAAGVAFPGLLALAGATRSVSAQWAAPATCLPCRVRIGGASATVWRLPGLTLAGIAALLAAGAGGLWVLRRRHARASPSSAAEGRERQTIT